MNTVRSMLHFQTTNQHTGSHTVVRWALVKLMNDILWNMECGEVTAFIAIDLLAAFDTVDHGILLDVLQYRFGVTGMVRKWFDSYLSPRQFQVNIG